MSKIRGGLKHNNLERMVHNWLKGMHIRHKMYPRTEGNPDIGFPDGSCVFVDGCFWHCCPEHYRRPKTNKRFWIPHIEGSNERREEKRSELPYRWIRIWEHEVVDGSYKEKIKSFCDIR